MGNLASFSGVLVANEILLEGMVVVMKLVVEILLKVISYIFNLFKTKKEAISIRIDIRVR